MARIMAKLWLLIVVIQVLVELVSALPMEVSDIVEAVSAVVPPAAVVVGAVLAGGVVLQAAAAATVNALGGKLLDKHVVGVPVTASEVDMARFVVDVLAFMAEHGGLVKNDGGHGGASSHHVLERGLLLDMLLHAMEDDAAPGLKELYLTLEWYITILSRAGLAVDPASKFILMVYILGGYLGAHDHKPPAHVRAKLQQEPHRNLQLNVRFSSSGESDLEFEYFEGNERKVERVLVGHRGCILGDNVAWGVLPLNRDGPARGGVSLDSRRYPKHSKSAVPEGHAEFSILIGVLNNLPNPTEGVKRFAAAAADGLPLTDDDRRKFKTWLVEDIGRYYSGTGARLRRTQVRVGASNAWFVADTVRRATYAQHSQLDTLQRERKVITHLSLILEATAVTQGAMSFQATAQNVRGGKSSPWATVGHLVSQVSETPYLYSLPLFITGELLLLLNLVRPQRASPFTVLWHSSQLRAGFLQLPQHEHCAAVLHELPTLCPARPMAPSLEDAIAVLQALPPLSSTALVAPPAPMGRVTEERHRIAKLVRLVREQRKVKAASAHRVMDANELGERLLPYKGGPCIKVAQLAALSPAVFRLAGLKLQDQRNAQRTDNDGRAAQETAIHMTYPLAHKIVDDFLTSADVVVGNEDSFDEAEVLAAQRDAPDKRRLEAAITLWLTVHHGNLGMLVVGVNALHAALDAGDEPQLQGFLERWPAVQPILAAVADGVDDEVTIGDASSEVALEALQSLAGSSNGALGGTARHQDGDGKPRAPDHVEPNGNTYHENQQAAGSGIVSDSRPKSATGTCTGTCGRVVTVTLQSKGPCYTCGSCPTEGCSQHSLVRAIGGKKGWLKDYTVV